MEVTLRRKAPLWDSPVMGAGVSRGAVSPALPPQPVMNRVDDQVVKQATLVLDSQAI